MRWGTWRSKDIFEELMHNELWDMAYLTRLQQVNEAIIDKWKQDVAEHPDDHQKKLDLAWCYYQNQREPEALEVFDTFEPEGDEIFFYCNAKADVIWQPDRRRRHCHCS